MHFTSINYNSKTFQMASLHPEDSMMKKWKIANTFMELDLLEHVRRLELKGTYVDAGANVGNHSVFFSNFMEGCTDILAIEPHPSIAEVLTVNLRNNCTVPWEVLQCAVSNESSEVYMSPLEMAHSGGTRVTGKESTSGTKVPSRKLDDILAGVRNLAFIKMDLESYEIYAVQGASHILSEIRPVITSELRSNEFAAFSDVMQKYRYKTIGRYGGISTYIWKPL